MIRVLGDDDLRDALIIINQAATAYKGVIPDDMWREPYMGWDEIEGEAGEGVVFNGFFDEDVLAGVMGVQDKGDVTLIRHAYVAPSHQRKGIGGRLLDNISSGVAGPMLVGTWADAWWALRFYEKSGFTLLGPIVKKELLKRYWSIPDRQVETSVVLADEVFMDSFL
ncbi:GNAT family N-acetyltransferase [Candidatus Altiarchaeota archaeon]